MHMSEAVRENEFQKKKFSLITEFLSSFFFPLLLLSVFRQAPSSLLEALEQHLASLEGKKTKELNADTR